jgi:hypothetical protein
MLLLLPWCSVSKPPLSLVSFRTPCSWDTLRGRRTATRDNRFDEYWSADEISSESRQNRWNTWYFSTAKARCTTDQRSIATEMLWVPLEGRSRTKSSRQRFHSQLCCQIVRYFCRTLYNKTVMWGILLGIYWIKPPAPTQRATVSLIKGKPWNALLHFLLVRICNQLGSVLRYQSFWTPVIRTIYIYVSEDVRISFFFPET